MKKTNFTLLSNSLKISVVLMLLGFYSNFSQAQFVMIDAPGIACGELSDNLLANPGFEDPMVSPGTEFFTGGVFPALPGWQQFGVNDFGGGFSNFIVENNFRTAARTGSNNLRLFGNFFSPFEALGLFQDLPAAPGETWAGSVFIQNPTSDPAQGNFSEMHVEFRDAAGNFVGGQNFASTPQATGGTAQGQWIEFSAVAEAPPGTATARFVILYFNVDFNGGSLLFDDASLRRVEGPFIEPVVVDGGMSNDLCLATVAVPPLETLFTVGDFDPIVFINDFNGGTDASGEYRFGTTTVNFFAEDANGNQSGSCSFDVVVEGNGTSSLLACNDNVQVSLDGGGGIGCSLVGADMILEGGNYGCFDQYELQRVPALITDCGEPPFSGNVYVACEDIGETIIIKVTDPESGNSCWGSVRVEDKYQPTLECDGPFMLDCSEDPTALPLPIADSNCDVANVFVVSQIESGGNCSTKTIMITYQAADTRGNLSSQCVREITVEQITNVEFPDNIEWSCTQFSNFSNITEATALDGAIDPEDASDETSATRLGRTGSGVPNVMGVSNSICNFSVTHEDQILEACSGVSTDIAFKLVRTWTVLNWCTGEVTNEIQVIEVVDTEAPTIVVTNTTLVVNENLAGQHGNACGASGLIAPPVIMDDCSGIASISVFTPQGEAFPVSDNNGNVIGYEIPEPLLPGQHDIVFRAVDNCTNLMEETIPFTVLDNTLPVPICREVTQISLGGPLGGVSEVKAEYFDEGSFDNCGRVSIKVRRMDSSCAGFNSDQTNFNDVINFCCEDVGQTINVILRAYDVSVPQGSISQNQFSDRSNECMIQVLVEDKSLPTCSAPDDVRITCADVSDNFPWTDDMVTNDVFGNATGFDNCGIIPENLNTVVQLNDCGIGRVVRTFRTIDVNGNVSTDLRGPTSIPCRQIITVEQVTDYCINIPADFEDECNNSVNPDIVTFEENGCDLIAINSEIQELLAGGFGECRKEIRTWYIIDWCEYDGVSAATVLGRGDLSDIEREMTGVTFCSNGTNLGRLDPDGNILPDFVSTGFYTYKQFVSIFDVTPPAVSFDGDVLFCGGDQDEDPCLGDVNISIDIEEECTQILTTTWALDVNSTTFNTTDMIGAGSTFGGRFPLGTHTIRFDVADDCGNVSQIDVTFEVVDCKAPTPVCFNGLSVELMPTGVVCVWARDFDASSFDFCHDFELTANVVTDRVPDGIINSSDYETTRPTSDTIKLSCANVGETTFVQLWVHELSDDGINDDDFCVATIDVQDNPLFQSCQASREAIVGTVKDESGENIDNAEVSVSGDMAASISTDDNGTYAFNVTEGNDYSVAVAKNDDIRNGVSTFDLALISKHVLNVAPLQNPYKIIAADANNSGSVTTLDLVAIRKVILFAATEFPNNSSWRFMDKDYIFSNSNNPFSDVLPEVRNFNNIVGVQTADFVGIKVGDVSGDAIANSLGGVEERSFNGTFFMNTEDKTFKAGDEVKVAFNADFNSIDGYQATLNFNSKALTLIDIESAVLKNEHFGTTMSENGILTLSWNGTTEKNDAFTLIFTAKTNGKLSDELSVNSAFTHAEAYSNKEVMNVGLNFGNTNSIFALHQNTPNPLSSETVIGFDLPSADAVTLTVSDLSGKILRVISGDYEAGYNRIQVVLTDNMPSGVLIYELETSTHKATKKMTVVR